MLMILSEFDIAEFFSNKLKRFKVFLPFYAIFLFTDMSEIANYRRMRSGIGLTLVIKSTL